MGEKEEQYVIIDYHDGYHDSKEKICSLKCLLKEQMNAPPSFKTADQSLSQI